MTDAPAAFSTHIFDGDPKALPAPTNGPYFLATRDGYMVHRRTPWGRVLVPTAKSPELPDSEALYWHDIDFPARLIGQAWGFFREVWKRRHSEAMVDITWSKTKGYRLFVPPQQTSGGGVKAFRKPEHYRDQIVGTIHSHCNFGAYHSSTDTHDADEQDGLHMTIGHVDSDKLDIAIMLSASKARWDIELDDVTDDEVTIQPFPRWWLGFVQDPAPTAYKPQQTTTYTGQHWKQHASTTQKPHGMIVIQGSGAAGDSYTSIDALIYSKNISDPTLLARLEQLAQLEDYMLGELDNLGLSLNLDIAGTPRLPTADNEEARFQEWLRTADTEEAQARQVLRLEGWDEDAIDNYLGV